MSYPCKIKDQEIRNMVNELFGTKFTEVDDKIKTLESISNGGVFKKDINLSSELTWSTDTSTGYKYTELSIQSLDPDDIIMILPISETASSDNEYLAEYSKIKYIESYTDNAKLYITEDIENSIDIRLLIFALGGNLDTVFRDKIEDRIKRAILPLDTDLVYNTNEVIYVDGLIYRAIKDGVLGSDIGDETKWERTTEVGSNQNILDNASFEFNGNNATNLPVRNSYILPRWYIESSTVDAEGNTISGTSVGYGEVSNFEKANGAEVSSDTTGIKTKGAKIHVEINSSTYVRVIQNNISNIMLDETYTFSLKYTNGNIDVCSFNIPSSSFDGSTCPSFTKEFEGYKAIFSPSVVITNPSATTATDIIGRLILEFTANADITMLKLEKGPVSTINMDNEMSVANTVIDLLRCAKNDDSNDTYANQEIILSGNIDNYAATKSSISNVILYADRWGEAADGCFIYNLSNSNVGLNDIVEISTTSDITTEIADAIINAKIYAGTQTRGSITLKAFGVKPEIDIPLLLIVRGDV